MPLKAGTYIAVEGPIGVGKTSLARILAEELSARLILEEVEDNPFLPDFYRQPKRFALQTQLTFLLSRHRQQSELRQTELFDHILISDFIFEKDRIFAQLTLEGRDLELYNRLAEVLAPETARPDLVVYLQAPPERLLTNIRIRNIPYESDISEEYLTNLCEIYNRFFFAWDESPLLIVNAARMDFVHNEQHRTRLREYIQALPRGTSYFNLEA